MTLPGGARLGPYEVVELLGAGGMGEVYRARDPRLGRDVAVKVLPEEVAADPQRLAFFEREARAVAALNHPNILTVHDVGTHDGVPYVVTELLEGENLRELVSRRSPTVKQILGYALQAARGLEAAHGKDIVHRDLKPENLFLTTDGRVKILDFGLAKLVRPKEMATDAPTPSRSTAAGQVVGTVAYMSPEQARGHPVDPRSDVFSFGVVLYELLAGKHPFHRDSVAATLTAIVEETPAGLDSLGRGIPPTVGGIVRRCLEKGREDRWGSGHDVAMVLDAVLAAPTGAAALVEVEERSPYPGLHSFTEKDAGVFFGREREVEALWGRIRSRELLAVIGPSGVGKTSFVRAGVIASRPEGWAAVHATPGSNPGLGLARALTPDLAGDAEAMGELLTGVAELSQTGEAERVVTAAKRWRSQHAEALLVMDQFEELFTLNPPETQARTAALLERLASEADVHVVLSMRDDFLIRCSDHETLEPVFESLTPLTALSRAGLRRAVVEPAKKTGYRFEDDALVEEMVSLVEGNRGALPLLAFAVARLWEKRDRERKLLTREAYQEIAGVEGALAQHAEATMDRIGSERQGLVREIFRNLVTAQGTRAVIDRRDLLSAFPEREDAGEVLDRLIDARLLTSYEMEGKEGEPSHHRIEVVHESLLKAWPRLVRWQTQDEDSAQLRDQLKQAAHLWEEKGRTPDLLWSGTAFQEFELWRERYPGKLTALEEDFSHSMVERARRRRRVRRAVVAAAFLVLAGFAAAITVSRQEATTSRDEARAEALRAEASRLVALAHVSLEEDPTEALAFIAASLELADTQEARVSTMKALGEAPPALELDVGSQSSAWHPSFSPDGKWVAAAGCTDIARVWSEDASGPLELPGHEPGLPCDLAQWVSPTHLVTGKLEGRGGRVHLWSVPEGKSVRTIEIGSPSWWHVGPGRLFAETRAKAAGRGREFYELRSWRLPDGEAEVLGRADPGIISYPFRFFAPDGSSWLYAQGRRIYVRPLPAEGDEDVLLDRQEAEVAWGGILGNRVWFRDSTGRMSVWSFPADGPRVKRIPKPATAAEQVFLESSGRWVTGLAEEDRQIRLWDLAAWPGARPLSLRRRGSWYYARTSFQPAGDWVVASTSDLNRLTFWPLRRRYPRVIDGYSAPFRPLAFALDSRWVATGWSDGTLRLWPLPGSGAREALTIELPHPKMLPQLAFDQQGRYLFLVGNGPAAYVVPLDGSPPRRLEGMSGDALPYAAAISPSGRRVASAVGFGQAPKELFLWDPDTGAMQSFALPEATSVSDPQQEPRRPSSEYSGGVLDLAFAGEASLYSAGDGGIRRWNLENGTHELVIATEPGVGMRMVLGPEGRTALVREWPMDDQLDCRPVELVDLNAGTRRPLPAFGRCFPFNPMMALDPSGSVAVTGDREGIVRVGKLSNGEPHLLVGHEGVADFVAISPDLRWVASTGEDNTLRLWPMPDLDKPPLHTLPRDELLAKLRSLTNLRAVRDPEAPNGWKIELDPFPGWKEVPTW